MDPIFWTLVSFTAAMVLLILVGKLIKHSDLATPLPGNPLGRAYRDYDPSQHPDYDLMLEISRDVVSSHAGETLSVAEFDRLVAIVREVTERTLKNGAGYPYDQDLDVRP